MKTLSHNGIMLSCYEPVGLTAKIKGNEVKLNPLQEEMAVALVKKEHLDSAKDQIFIRNFFEDFSRAFNGAKLTPEDVDFSAVRNFVNKQKDKKEKMTPEDKKTDREQRKKASATNKEKYGYAVVDGKKVELANYKVEPAGIFMGRGEHPLRGRWKTAVRVEDITLNLSEEAKIPSGFEKAKREWAPDGFWIAKWDNNRKYVWISDAEPMKQDKDAEKYDKAVALSKNINSVKMHIMMNLGASDLRRRKVATCAYLIQKLGIRVGDEKDPDEADTVGATTLRSEHISFDIAFPNRVNFKFLGKDCVPFNRDVDMLPAVAKNLADFKKEKNGSLFGKITSVEVNNFLKEAMPGLTAKVFRTYIASKVVFDYLVSQGKITDEGEKVVTAKMANLEAAMAMNHQRKIPANYDEVTDTKKLKLLEVVNKLKEEEKRSPKGGKVQKLREQAEKVAGDILLRGKAREFNLNTSLRSYVDPRIFGDWAADVNFDLSKLYPATLLRKFSWALKVSKEEVQKKKN